MKATEPSGITWQTSTYTSGEGNCVEVGTTEDALHVRDTKNRPGGMLTVTRSEWRAFLAEVTAR